MNEMREDLGMTGVLKNTGRPFRSVEVFIIAGVQGIGASRHKQSLNCMYEYAQYFTDHLSPLLVNRLHLKPNLSVMNQ